MTRIKKLLAYFLSALLIAGFFSPFLTHAENVTHVVQEGDRLWRIAREHGITYEELAAYNDLPDPAFIRAGQVLRIPAPGWTPREADFSFITYFFSNNPYATQHNADKPGYINLYMRFFDIDGNVSFDQLETHTTHVFIKYMAMYELHSHIADYELIDLHEALLEQGFIFQSIAAIINFSAWHFYYHPLYKTSIIIAPIDILGEVFLQIMIVSGNFYEMHRDVIYAHAGFIWDESMITDLPTPTPTPAPTPAPTPTPVPTHSEYVVGTWRFYDTSDNLHYEFIQSGVILYILEQDGTGYWVAIDANKQHVNLVPLTWYTVDNILRLRIRHWMSDLLPGLYFYYSYVFSLSDGFLIFENERAWHKLTPAPPDL